jgi:hypothetical protein
MFLLRAAAQCIGGPTGGDLQVSALRRGLRQPEAAGPAGYSEAIHLA